MIERRIRDFIGSLAARTATPASGTAAAYTALMGVALLTMVVRFARGKPVNACRDRDLAAAEKELEQCMERMSPTGERDAAAFEHVAVAYTLGKETEHEREVRERAIEEALFGAIIPPEEILCLVRDAFVAVEGVVDCAGRNLASDLAAGSTLLGAGADTAKLIVRINAGYLHDTEKAEATLERVAVIIAEIREHQSRIQQAVTGLVTA